jgi:hypothetical protein
MAHFAELDANNVVIRVIVIADENESDGENFCANLLGGRWKQTSYNTIGNRHRLGGTPFRKNYASTGYTYDEARDAYIPPQPYPSWSLDEDTCLWGAPIPYPIDGGHYVWNEPLMSWTQIG